MTYEMDPTTLTCDEIRELAGAFVLGALDSDEQDAVRSHLATCPDAHAEIAEVGQVLPILAASVPQVEPSAGLRARIMGAAAADLAARSVPAPATSATPAVTPPSAAPTVTPPYSTDSTTAEAIAVVAFPSSVDRAARTSQAARSTTRIGWAIRIAAVVVIGVLAGWNALLTGQLDQTRTYERSVAAVLDVAGRDGSVTAVLTAKGKGGAAGLAAVSADGSITLAMRDLAPTSGDQVYEAWLIGSDGKPVALGGFSVGTAGTALFEARGLIARVGDTLALTLEPKPGLTAPTGPVVSAGATTG